MNSVPSPSTPSPTTERPITSPPEKATLRAAPKLVRAALVVRTLALVATLMPMKPASAEHNAPTMNGTTISHEAFSWIPLTTPSRTATAMTKTASTRYSRARNARAPSAMLAAISCISGVPSSCLLTHPARIKA